MKENNYMKKDKKFLKPEANIIDLINEDIITGSSDWWEGGNDIGGGTGGDVPNN